MKNIIINGLNIGKASNVTGIQRFSREVIYRLDLFASDISYKIYYLYNPNFTNIVVDPKKLKNIIPIEYNQKNGIFSKFVTHLKIAKKYNGLMCSFALDSYINKNQISCIHDMRPIYWKTDSFKFRFQYKLFLKIQKKFASTIITVSNFSKNQILKYLHINEKKIHIVYPGFDHIKSIKVDDNIFLKNPLLKENEYYYALGSIAPHKNFNWIINQAKLNPNKLFVIGGGKNSIWKSNETLTNLPNLIFLGYVSDEENKSLMMNCKAFLHPSKYEGFGIPPLEALYCGTTIFISSSSCLPEIYEDCAHYFDPDDFEYDIESHLNDHIENPQKLFKKYTWDKCAVEILKILNDNAAK